MRVRRLRSDMFDGCCCCLFEVILLGGVVDFVSCAMKQHFDFGVSDFSLFFYFSHKRESILNTFCWGWQRALFLISGWAV